MGRPHPFPCQNFGAWELQEEYVKAKSQRAVQPHIKSREVFFYFPHLGYGITIKKTLKSHLEGHETAVCYEHKE